MIKSHSGPGRCRKDLAHLAAHLVSIAIGHGALVLHTQVGRVYQLVAVLGRELFTEPELKAVQHRLYNGEVLLAFSTL